MTMSLRNSSTVRLRDWWMMNMRGTTRYSAGGKESNSGVSKFALEENSCVRDERVPLACDGWCMDCGRNIGAVKQEVIRWAGADGSGRFENLDLVR